MNGAFQAQENPNEVSSATTNGFGELTSDNLDTLPTVKPQIQPTANDATFTQDNALASADNSVTAVAPQINSMDAPTITTNDATIPTMTANDTTIPTMTANDTTIPTEAPKMVITDVASANASSTENKPLVEGNKAPSFFPFFKKNIKVSPEQDAKSTSKVVTVTPVPATEEVMKQVNTESKMDPLSVLLLNLGFIFLLYYAFTQIFNFYGIGSDVYGMYFSFYLFLYLTTLILPSDYAKITN